MSETYISITQFSNYVKNIFDAEIMLHHIYLYGEISAYKVSNNIAYFTLKDEGALLNCVMFNANQFDTSSVGDMVLVNGSPNYYVKGGRFSFQVGHMEPYGKGKLYEDFLKLKAKLDSMGYFDPSIKKEIPRHVRRIGVVTSKEGAVIQDIINVTTRRNSTIDIVLYPVKVQGIGAEQEIAEGINYFSNYGGVDCVVVARGGGSVEDLQAYNTEVVAHAVHYCTLPVISAVGHETDFSICDFCSDLRVPTPSAAAEVLAWDLNETIEIIKVKQSFMQEKVLQEFTNLQAKLLSNQVKMLSMIDNDVEKVEQTIENQMQLLQLKVDKNLMKKTHECDLCVKNFETKNPKNLLLKGYVKLHKDGKVIKNKKELQMHQEVSVTYLDGKVNLIVEKEG